MCSTHSDTFLNHLGKSSLNHNMEKTETWPEPNLDWITRGGGVESFTYHKITPGNVEDSSFKSFHGGKDSVIPCRKRVRKVLDLFYHLPSKPN